ncbi:hypothetical protein AVEN_136423-1 [Araneus ventricosus]|uniref:Uncharacterized protein n=1 Tax=Araneus ventricosus TaxID=182803 RepID=A0A4Y2JSC7_ARAVE|nr:hypothetical protein AVEN_136423-1 [Araneus ventricosus]
MRFDIRHDDTKFFMISAPDLNTGFATVSYISVRRGQKPVERMAVSSNGQTLDCCDSPQWSPNGKNGPVWWQRLASGSEDRDPIPAKDSSFVGPGAREIRHVSNTVFLDT